MNFRAINFSHEEQNYINLIIQFYTYEISFDPFCDGASNSSQQQVVSKREEIVSLCSTLFYTVISQKDQTCQMLN